MSDYVNTGNNQPKCKIGTVRLPNGDVCYKMTSPMPEWLQEYLDNATDEEREIAEGYIKDAIKKKMQDAIKRMIGSVDEYMFGGFPRRFTRTTDTAITAKTSFFSTRNGVNDNEKH